MTDSKQPSLDDAELAQRLVDPARAEGVSLTGPGGLLGGLVTSLDVGFWKPHAAMFEHALELLGVDAAQAVMVGDSPTRDVAPAKKLGVRAAEPAVGDTGAVSLGTRVMRQVAARQAPFGAGRVVDWERVLKRAFGAGLFRRSPWPDLVSSEQTANASSSDDHGSKVAAD